MAIDERVLCALEAPVLALRRHSANLARGINPCGIGISYEIRTICSTLQCVVDRHDPPELALWVKQQANNMLPFGYEGPVWATLCNYGYFRALVLCQEGSHMVQGPLGIILHRTFLY